MTIRPAETDDFPRLPMIESASDTLLRAFPGMDELPAGADEPEFRDALALFVAGRPCVGFARLETVDGGAHLEQLSVVPEYGRRGIGKALVVAAMSWASTAGYTSMTLSTFADVPFNAPFYAGCGFDVVLAPEGALAALRVREVAMGLDAMGARVAMRVLL